MLKKIWMTGAILAVATAGLAQVTAKIHGHVQDPLAIPMANASVIVATTANVPVYTFTTDASGDYTGSGITPGTYTILLRKAPDATASTAKLGEKTSGNNKISDVIDAQPNVHLPGPNDTQVDFDLSRKEYIDKLSPAARKALDELRAKNAKAMTDNVQIKAVNGWITQARDARKAGNFDQAIVLDQQATQARPTEGLLWYELAASQSGAKKYDDAATNYKKALDLLQAAKPQNPEEIASTDNDLGGVYAKTGKTDLALAAYDAAVKTQPTNAALFYGNEAVVLFKAGQGDAASVAADKAIAADPTKPIPYYIKGWSLAQKATIDPKTQKIVLPAGCADAYRKFLELSPSGPLADDARGILSSAGETIHSSYKKH